MKVSKDLADVLRKAGEEVDAWPQWQRSLDPIGNESREHDPHESESSQSDSVEDSNAA